MTTAHDQRYLALLSFLVLLGFLGLLETQNGYLRAPASIASLSLLIFSPRFTEKIAGDFGGMTMPTAFASWLDACEGRTTTPEARIEYT